LRGERYANNSAIEMELLPKLRLAESDEYLTNSCSFNTANAHAKRVDISTLHLAESNR
jgi:hypothetical protein